MPGDRVPTPAPRRAPLFRLRSVLLLGAVAGSVAWAHPRATAAVELHSSATAFADYALCMVGPTGPQLLRDNPEQFSALLRRRLVGAEPEERPFAACASAARQLSGSAQVAAAHGATASSFVEYGTDAADRAARGSTRELSTEKLKVTTRKLAALARAAWPFVRHGYTTLVQPSLGAREAVHPVALARPALGQGLPDAWDRYRAVRHTAQGWLVAFGTGANVRAFQSSDGVKFSPAPSASLSELAGRCGQGNTTFSFGMSDDLGVLEVAVVARDGDRRVLPLATAEHQVFTASCDADSVAVGLARDDGTPVGLTLCTAAGGCAPLRLPPLGQQRLDARFAIDVARVDGVIVVSAERNGVVRVTSSRDDGKTWTPFTVAFDAGADPSLAALPVPERMLVFGARVFLYAGAAEAEQVYPVLASDDYGASWRTPAEATPALARAGRAPLPNRSSGSER